MKDTDKMREELIKEVASLRQQIAELKRVEIEHKRVEEALRGSEEELEMILNDARIGIAIFDKTGKILRVNKRILEIGGYAEKEIVGKRFKLLKMFPPRSMATMLANFTKLIAGKKAAPFDVEVYTKKGELLTTELHGSLLRKKGEVAGMVGIMRDITERRKTEEQLKKEKESFFSILQEAPNGVALIDKDGKYLYVNAKFSTITGYTLKNISTGKDWFRRAYPDPQYRQEVIETWKRDIARGTIDRVFSVVCKNGEVKEIEFRGTVLEDERAIVILTDITERKHAEEAYHVVVEHSLQGLHILQDQREVFANSAYAEMLGYTVEELLALSPKKTTKLVYPEDQERVWGYYRNHLEGKSVPPRYEFRIIRKDGSVRWVEAFSSRIEYRGKSAVQVAMVDITERKQAESTLKSSEERYRTLVESSTDAIIMLGRNRNVITCNQAFLNLFGYRKGDVEGRSVRIIHRSAESFRTYEKTTYPLVERVGSLREEWDFMRKNGTIFPAEIVTSPVRSPDGKTAAYICIIRDITERKQAEEELEYMATHDVLTGLPNRTLFNDRLTIALTHARRSHKNLAVMLLDLDYFKDVNDTLGHSMGDQLLCVVGNRLTEVLRKGDTVARIGGDEFLLLLPEMARIEDASTIAQKILESFRTPFAFDNQQLHITTSIGIVFFPDDGEDPDTLVKNADIAMYRAKERGRDTFQCYSSAPR